MEWLKKYEAWWGKIIFFAALLLYANTIPNDYNLDDELVTRNHRLTSQGISAIPEIISSYYYEDKFGHRYDYRPVVHISFALEHELFGESPHISHLINIILYAFVCWLLWFFLSQLFPHNLKLLAWMATLLFVFHPMHTEVVASIKNRDEILALGFALISGYSMLKYFESKNSVFIFLSVIGFALGMLSKTTIIALVILLPLAMILFKSIPFKVIIFISIPVLITGIGISNFEIKQKIILFILSMVFLSFLYTLDKKNPLYIKLKNFIRDFLQSNSDFFKNLRNESVEPIIRINLKSDYLLVVNFGIFLIFFAIILLDLSGKFPAFFILSILPFFSKQNLNQAISLSLLFTSIILLNIFGYDTFEIKKLFVTLILLQIFLSDNKTILIINIILYLVFSIYDSTLENLMSVESLVNFIILCAVVLLNLFKYKLRKELFLMIILIIISIKLISDGLSFDFYILGLLLTAILLIIIYLNKLSFHLLSIFIVIFSSIWMIKESAKRMSLENYLKTTITEDIFIEKSEKDKEHRPLFYAESPVNMKNSLSERMGTGMIVFGKYIRNLLVPTKMGFYYGYAFITSKHIYQFWPAILFILYISIVLLGLYLKTISKKVLAFSVLFLSISFIPILNIFFPIAGVMADRYLLIPSIGFCLLLAYGIHKLIEHEKSKTIGLSVLGFILIGYGYLTIKRNFEWKDKLTLFENDIEYLYQSAQAHALLGSEYMAIARNIENEEQQKIWISKSKSAYENAINIYPNFWNWHFINGINNMSLGFYEEAINSFKKSIEKKPDFSHEPYYYVGYIYFEQGKFIDAANYFEQTLEHGHKTPEIFNYLAVSYSSLNLTDNAISSLTEGLKFFPNDYNLNLNAGKMYYNLGDKENAKKYISIALSIDSRNSDIVNLLKSIE
jgi:tetratricopeptide (TPR) repeat protein